MIKHFCLVFMAFLALNSFAQVRTTSPYSFYGIGSLKFKGTVENRSMGGLSIYTDSIHINLRNPASYAGKNIQTFPFGGENGAVKYSVGGSSTSTELSTSSDSDRLGKTTFDYLAVALPMGKVGVGFGLLPYTAVGYRLESYSSPDVLDYQYSGEGGLNKAYLGLGYQIANNLNIGVDASYNFGNIQNNVVQFRYDDEGLPLQYQSKENNRSDLSGLNFNFGLTYTPMISEKLKLTTAFTYSPKADLTSNNQRTISTIVINPDTGADFPVNQIDIDLSADGIDKTELSLPAKTSFGIGVGEELKWFLGGEYTLLKTSEFSNEIFSFDNAKYEDATTISVGGFYIPQYNSFKYWKRIVYRAGFRYENTGLEINNEAINEFGITFGVGLPVGNLFSNANLGLEIGQRGTVNQNLVKENFVSFQLSLSLNDRWFVKRKYN
ncbi:hypothetical protein U0L90_00220 [Flavobacteriaceae sp. LMIT009]